jgi:hypothetical protein
MNLNEFKQYYQEFEQKCEEIIGFKSDEYSTDEDKLWNFKIIAAITGLKPSQVALIHGLKHTVTIARHIMAGTGEMAWETVGGEGLKQRFADQHNYNPLMCACLEEERNKPVKAIVPDKNKAFAKYPKTFEEIMDDYLATVNGLRILNLNPTVVMVDQQTYKVLQTKLKLKNLTIDYEREIPVMIDPVAVGYTVRVLPQPEELLKYTASLGEGEW